MAHAKKGLGRGLSALIPDDDMDFLSRVARGVESYASLAQTHGTEYRATTDTTEGASEAVEGTLPPQAGAMRNEAASAPAAAKWLPIAAIQPNPYQPRRFFNDQEMAELVDSVQTHGVLQPILVRPLLSQEGPLYQLVAGERRWRAAQQAGLVRVPAIVRELPDQQAMELALIENMQRQDISSMDAALAFRRLAAEFSMSQEDIARRVGKSRSAVANTMRLLDLPDEAQKAIEDGAISEGHGRAILLASGDGARRAVFRRILRDKLSVRDSERLGQAAAHHGAADNGPQVSPAGTLDGSDGQAGGGSVRAQARLPQSDLQQAEASLQKTFGTRARIRPKGKGGQVVIDFYSEEELQRLLVRFAELHP